MPALQTAFAELEDKMAALSAAIGKTGELLTTEAKASVKQVQLAIAAALLLAALVGVIAAFLLDLTHRLHDRGFAADALVLRMFAMDPVPGVRLTVIAGAQGVKNDLVDIETHVTKP